MGDVECVHWYAVYVRSRHEKKVHQLFLEKELTSFLPLLETMRQWSDRKKKVYEPLFRGYVFVNIAMRRDHIRVLDTDGVIKFIGIGKKPSVIGCRDIEWLKTLVRESDSIHQTVDALPPGQLVRVLAGPFKDFEGVVLKGGRESRLVVFFDSIMQGVEISIFPELLVPIARRSTESSDVL
ncbi:UpxY family transcription antiterminator [Chlorobium phaeobacteroides]|jgi:transcription antitermination factor NusG|uniref:Transcription antitermination protein nusG n=1 Tax=Chlorobium phaeobacteroides (strain DSM 266 / SMG 266 / 2430) TaxID=290317 RepID=A1BJK5_CHLPD|nr:UpxY family transcription antiterminator [Chlorobium phaeobacteroides]ABL66582.1 transcription antitermination protein nusG [Chlorobium phaeobacteroides DSM 266]